MYLLYWLAKLYLLNLSTKKGGLFIYLFFVFILSYLNNTQVETKYEDRGDKKKRKRRSLIAVCSSIPNGETHLADSCLDLKGLPS